MAFIQKLKKEWFLVGMLVAIGLAVLTPDLGRSGGVLHLGTVTSIGVALVFFLHGLGLSLSSILGVFITPLLIQLFMEVEGAELDLMASVFAISKLLLLPMIVGQLLRPYLLKFAQKHKAVVNKIDKYVILLIVYSAFCDSVANGIWGDFSIGLLSTSVAICLVCLLIVVHSLQWIARRVGFEQSDEVAAVFCGTKKTLAAGVPMAKVIFGADPNLGMMLLPIMLYHPIQIFYCAALANRYAAKSTEATAK